MSNLETAPQSRALPPHGVRVGSQSDCDIVLADSSVSPVHAEIQAEGSTITVINKTDARGVALLRDGRKTALFHEAIHAGDRVRFGEVEMSFEEIIEAIRFRYPNFAFRERSQSRRVRLVGGHPLVVKKIWFVGPAIVVAIAIGVFLDYRKQERLLDSYYDRLDLFEKRIDATDADPTSLEAIASALHSLADDVVTSPSRWIQRGVTSVVEAAMKAEEKARARKAELEKSRTLPSPPN